MRPRIIVCGLGRTGYQIYSLLRKQGAEVTGVSDRSIPTQPQEKIIIGDPRTVTTLIEAGIRKADTLVLASNDDALNLAVLTQAKRINPNIRIINRLLDRTLGELLDRTLSEHFTMSVAALAAPIFAFAALGNRAIGQLRLFERIWPTHEEIIEPDHPWLGKHLQELWSNPARMLIYYLPVRGEIDLISAIITGKTLELGDRLIIGTKPTVQRQRYSWWRKLVKAVTNLPQYQRYARPVTLVTLSLSLTIFLATLTYVSVNWNTSIVDALYFSVGMITGAGGQEQVAEQAPALIKVFTAMMMIVGAGVIGIGYALINDFVLGSRLQQALDVARVPARNHYIVCGLGGIGFTIVRQLHSQGYEVVALDSDPHNRFLHSTRSLGVPVLIESASLEATLKTVHIERAESLMAVTSNELTNLEIALTAKAIAPEVTTILRSYESQLAQSMQEVFAFERVLSPIELSTESFAAAALGGRILGSGMTGDLLWVALGTTITPQHPFCGQSIEQAAISADFVPLYLERKGRTVHSWELLESCLQPQDVLYLTMPASRLEQLWRTPTEKTRTK
ncbi:MAG: NAD-binding protein [Xenococcaceae cyanobacterium MO_188.B32]|nr:NAD-binding protein [Xenococcaceae cyanobacterium MO_188.B32]